MSRWTVLLFLACFLGHTACAPSAPVAETGVTPPDSSQVVSGPTFDLHLIERLVHERINAARGDYRLAPLRLRDPMSQLAQMHSRDMAENGFYDHTNVEGESPQDRADRARLECALGENLFQTYLFASYETTYHDGASSMAMTWKTEHEIAEAAVSGWLASPTHRALLLRSSYSIHGIGAARSDDLQLFITQTLC